ncbi:MAG: RHS repeat-associated core domain-containing protein [Acidobacteria bacterium]|nr:RHS repeat-associated core domain-containing protein [Acidobacteriota bacterium]
MQFDSKNRMISKKFPLTPSDNGSQREMRAEYNKNDELIAEISPSNRSTHFTYDARGQRKTMTDPLNGTVSYDYDINQNLISLRDQRNNTTQFDYDELYRLTKVTDPLGKFIIMNYDSEGNITSQIDRLNRTTTTTYDILDRPLIIQYTDANVSWQYDAAGRKIRVDDTQFGGTFIAWTYDNANRLLSETTNRGTVSYTYDQANERISMTVLDRPPVNYTYDSAKRLSTISQNLGQNLETFTFNYDILSRRMQLQRPNGVNTTYEYDQEDRLTKLKYQKANDPIIEDFQYAYNADKEIASITSLFSTPRIPSVDRNASTAKANNIISQFGGNTFQFNNVGETVSKTDSTGTTQYQWDHRGRLTQATLANNEQVSYKYDSINRMNSTTTNGQTTSFLYDLENIVLDINDDSSKVDYINSLGIDEKLRQFSSSTSFIYFIHNHLQSTVALTNNSGNLMERIQYEAFGQSTGSMLTRFTYTGREQDYLTKLNYYRARWYDSQQGRFLSEDQIGMADEVNLYIYVGNNPIFYIDPLGLQKEIPLSDKQKNSFNCLAWGLGFSGGGGVGPGYGTWPKETRPDDARQLRKYGCTSISCDSDKKCSCQQYKIKLYVPISSTSYPWPGWHVMRQDCGGKWSSKDGLAGGLYTDITDPDSYWQKEFVYAPEKAYKSCYCCPARNLKK